MSHSSAGHIRTSGGERFDGAMESENLRKRTRDDRGVAATADDRNKEADLRERPQKSTIPKRGLRSLALSLAVPTLLTLSGSHFAGRGGTHPPGLLSVLHATSLAGAFLGGFAAWLFWAEGGFHRNPGAARLYVAWIVSAAAWSPVVVGLGASRVGVVLSGAMVWASVGCWRAFREVSPIAGGVVKPCLALAGVLALVNLRLVFAGKS